MEEQVVAESAIGTEFGVVAMFMQADPVVKAVMIVLAIASVWSWAIIIDKSLTFSRLRSKAKKFEEQFYSGRPLDDLYRRLKDRLDHPMARVFVAGMDEFAKSVPAGGFAPSSVQRAERRMMAEATREIERAGSQLPVLATIGSVAPFIGLFGTVWGIMNSFQGIAQTGDANLAVVAPGIAEALFATAIGLVAAIPAVVGYNRYTAALNSYVNRIEGFTGEFTAILSRQADGSR
ncbi:protein TolQ [Parvularcula lutaonensis]|uniref:Tol-Pal system protein TolQ n=1 Tax=Parvularcula lutaonensis TaxID=491923 RepID=A0ABV7MDM9_9PROT|nr:protein TolQ [Parvularcula lutaonensis]GGY53596.1 Tol-Pal system subunit TolQ [Parvularcula lutaonensis]